MKFLRTVILLSAKSGTPIDMTPEQAMLVVNTYRGRYTAIRLTWKELDQVLAMMPSLPPIGDSLGYQKGPMTFHQNLMMGPTGLPIHFPDLRYYENEHGETAWWFRDGRKRRRTYGASLLETIAQNLSRLIVMAAAVRLRGPMAQLGAKLVHTAHDELVFHVPVQQVENAKIWAELEMKRPPPWMPNLPLDCDTGVAVRYGDAK